MKEILIMTPGPTAVAENVRLARAKVTTNPDIDLEFYDFYKRTCDKLAQFLKTKNDLRILAGEGILGLEAACASLTESGDRVLVLDNGIFGHGFAEFVELYGGQALLLQSSEKEAFDIEILEKFLEKDHDFKYATIVHCDTPSGVLNDLSKICPLLKKYGILTVVDSVAAMGGEDLQVDNWQIDIALGGSQKVLSAPPGLTIVSISPLAYQAMENRQSPIASFYCNLLTFKDYYEKKWFPYTMPISDIYGLDQAVDNILFDQEILKRHAMIGKATRKAIKNSPLELYLQNGYSNTVSVIKVPNGLNDQELLRKMRQDYQVMITGSFDRLAGKVLRIGHMGENARTSKVAYSLYALQKVLEESGLKFETSLQEDFLQALK
ncbi:pyridoxal-phosphate-dependent aminotransferase family protein [Lactococcus cremoris]|uniref:pyridoxal-phosphate-dependent aminotransferase family protein n=1 Tax=Lactococcus lactis subsp. cremoris TaxID=1359 RepID=UPI0007AEB0AA|nr:alanine--glyoxylate aminotransferase family protein [Lactococcus cremoris]